MKVKKRDGRLEEFDSNKIYSAISKAGNLTYADINPIVQKVVKKLKKFSDISVHDVQTAIENELMHSHFYDVARNYISYRHLHDVAREKYAQLLDIVDEKLFAKNVQNQNANVDEKSFGGRKGEMTNELLKDYALNYCMSKMARDNHLNNEIYIHDLDSYALGLHNCFVRDTKFITDEGIKSFAQFSDGDNIRVLSSDGKWREAVVHYYGRKPMQKIIFARAGKEVAIDCTADHRWILSSGEVTTNIKVGDKLLPLLNSTEFSVCDKRSAEMFCFGFIIGDGCDHGNYIQARLCRDKLKYADIFNQANYRVSPVKGSFDLVYIKNKLFGKQQFLTTYGWRLLSFDDKVSLFNGYMAADGSVSNKSTKLVWTSDERVLQMVKEISALAGYHIYKIRTIHGDTNYKKDRLLYEIVFTTQYENNTTWVVKDIKKKYNKDYEAWCVEEPVTKSFTLAGGIVTGNCLSLPLDHLLAEGFNTRQVDIRPANSINTAMQLVAVLFQLQSLSQFGGVAATHLDWTMIPYVRKSFNKHFCDGLEYIEEANDLVIVYKEPCGAKVVDISIDDSWYKKMPKVYKYAMDMTIKETEQAVEGLMHNLNSLQSRSGRLIASV